jgi:hypothetical protein
MSRLNALTPIEADQLTVVPANEVSWADLQDLASV